MASLTPVFGMVAAGAVAFGGYKILTSDDTSVTAETEFFQSSEIMAQPAAPVAQVILASAEPEIPVLNSAPLDMSAEAEAPQKIGFPPLFVVGLMINCVTDKFAGITGEEA